MGAQYGLNEKGDVTLRFFQPAKLAFDWLADGALFGFLMRTDFLSLSTAPIARIAGRCRSLVSLWVLVLFAQLCLQFSFSTSFLCVASGIAWKR